MISANLEKRFVQKARRDRTALPTKKQKFSEMRDFSSESCSDESLLVGDCATTDHFLSEPEAQIRDETSERYGVNTQDESPSEASFNDDQNATEDRISSNYAPETDMRSSHCHENEPKASNNDEKLSSDGFEEATDFGSVTEQNFVTAIHSICAKHGTSDQELKDWLALMKTAFPNSYVASFRKVKSMYHVPAKFQENCLKKCESGQFWFLDFKSELLKILSPNWDSIEKYSKLWKKETDINVKPCIINENRTVYISLIMNSDGVRFVKSSPVQLWPVWFAVANLPPALRCSFKNIILGALWYGFCKPDWNGVFGYLSLFFPITTNLELKNVRFKVVVRLVLLVADIPAKASILNMHHHLAKYACTLCHIETQLEDRIRYFPYKKFPMRTIEGHAEDVQQIQRENLNSIRGIKGPSILFELIPNLPLTAPYDCMHQVYLGVTKVLLQVIIKKREGRSRVSTAFSIKLQIAFRLQTEGQIFRSARIFQSKRAQVMVIVIRACFVCGKYQRKAR